jgi:hypothetical protein
VTAKLKVSVNLADQLWVSVLWLSSKPHLVPHLVPQALANSEWSGLSLRNQIGWEERILEITGIHATVSIYIFSHLIQHFLNIVTPHFADDNEGSIRMVTSFKDTWVRSRAQVFWVFSPLW